MMIFHDTPVFIGDRKLVACEVALEIIPPLPMRASGWRPYRVLREPELGYGAINLRFAAVEEPPDIGEPFWMTLHMGDRVLVARWSLVSWEQVADGAEWRCRMIGVPTWG